MGLFRSRACGGAHAALLLGMARAARNRCLLPSLAASTEQLSLVAPSKAWRAARKYLTRMPLRCLVTMYHWHHGGGCAHVKEKSKAKASEVWGQGPTRFSHI